MTNNKQILAAKTIEIKTTLLHIRAWQLRLLLFFSY